MRRRGLLVDTTVRALNDVIRDGQNLPTLGGPVGGHLEMYVQWIMEAERLLTPHFIRRDVEDLLLTPRYWEIRRAREGYPGVNNLVRQEAEARLEDLTVLRDALTALRDRFAGAERVLVPDTNVFLHHTFFLEAPWGDLCGGGQARIVLPLVVVDELDRLKTSRNSKVAERARQVIRAIA
ncbi:MAG: PIN domain-containing protein, partial [Acidimicrobiales bacterium]